MELRKTLEEVNALYQMEPELRDIYVEGSVDCNFFQWYLDKQGFDNIGVYPIDLVDVPKDILHKHSLPAGSNKSRVIALSLELASSPIVTCVMCIVDRDFENWIDDVHQNACLQRTDGNSLELYAVQPQVFKKFVQVTLGGLSITPLELLSRSVAVLERICAIRGANEYLGWGMSWIPFGRYISITGSSIALREADFIRAYLQKNGRWVARGEFVSAVDKVFSSLDDDPMKRIRGHDLSELLFIILNKVRKDKRFGNPETLESCLLATVETNDLVGYSLFRKIVSFSKEESPETDRQN